MEIEKATEVYLEYREADCAHQTVQSYQYRLKKFEDWWDNDVEELEKNHVHEYKTHLQGLDLAKATVKSHMDTLRGYLDYMSRLGYIDEDLVDVADSPTLSGGDNVRDDEVEADVARAILTKLDKYEYASLPHALILLLWRTGVRTGTVRAIDLSDYHPDDGFLDVEHRPEGMTPLKNKKWGERKIALSDETCAVLDDYIAENRFEVVDEHGRKPLLTTKMGRIARNTIRKWCYRLTRPCWYADTCPAGRDFEECKGSVERSDNYSYECPESVAAHAFRRGAITHFLRRDLPEKVVSDRADVSQDVLDKHYDRRTDEEKMEQRREFIDDI